MAMLGCKQSNPQQEIYNKALCIKQSYLSVTHSEKMYNFSSSGTGTVVAVRNNRSYILTNAHVVKGMPTVTYGTLENILYTYSNNVVNNRKRDNHPLRLVAIDDKADFALLEYNGVLPFTPMKVHNPSIGDKILFAGFPYGQYKISDEGQISGVTDMNGNLFYLTNMDVMRGCSGGMAYYKNQDDSLSLVGIVSMMLNPGIYGLIRPANEATEFINNYLNNAPKAFNNVKDVLKDEAPYLITKPINNEEYFNKIKDYKLVITK